MKNYTSEMSFRNIIFRENVHVNDVACNGYALAGFLVSMLFGVSPGQS